MPATAITLRNPWLAGLFGDSLGDCLLLLDRALWEGSLGTSDVYTVHDLLDLGGKHGDDAIAALLILLFMALSEGSPCVRLDASSLAHRLGELGHDDPHGLAGNII